MTVEEAICARVANLAPVVAIVGTRVWLATLPQNPTYPCVRVSLIDDIQGQHLRGPEILQAARIQVDCYSQEASGLDAYAQASDLESAVHGDGLGPSASGLFGWVGVIGSPGLRVVGVTHRARLQRYDPEELRVFTISHDYIVRYKDS